MRATALFFLSTVLLEPDALPVAIAMIAVLSVIEAIGRRMGDRDEEKMREFLLKGLDG